MTTEYTPARAVEDSERWEALLDALRVLDPVDQDIVYRRYFQDESYEALGKLHGLSAEAIGFRLHRARRQLRKRLEAMFAVMGLSWGVHVREALSRAFATMTVGPGSAVGIVSGLTCMVGIGGMIVFLNRSGGDAAVDTPMKVATPAAREIGSPSARSQAGSAATKAAYPQASDAYGAVPQSTGRSSSTPLSAAVENPLAPDMPPREVGDAELTTAEGNTEMTHPIDPTFDDLAALDTRALAAVLQHSRWIDELMLPYAVAGSSEPMRAKLFAAMTPTIRSEVEQQLEVWASQREPVIQAKGGQAALAKIAKQFVEEGRISFGSS